MAKNKFRVDESRVSIRAFRTMADAEFQHFRPLWKDRQPATRQEFAPPGIADKLRWIRDKFLMREGTI